MLAMAADHKPVWQDRASGTVLALAEVEGQKAKKASLPLTRKI
jgi:hypothetical protein